MSQTRWDSDFNNVPFTSLSEADVIALVNRALSGNAARTSTYKVKDDKLWNFVFSLSSL